MLLGGIWSWGCTSGGGAPGVLKVLQLDQSASFLEIEFVFCCCCFALFQAISLKITCMHTCAHTERETRKAHGCLPLQISFKTGMTQEGKAGADEPNPHAPASGRCLLLPGSLPVLLVVSFPSPSPSSWKRDRQTKLHAAPSRCLKPSPNARRRLRVCCLSLTCPPPP